MTSLVQTLRRFQYNHTQPLSELIHRNYPELYEENHPRHIAVWEIVLQVRSSIKETLEYRKGWEYAPI